jgi:hypothetical protein
MGVRRINVLHAPFNFQWPKASVVTCIRKTGIALVKDEVADAAVKAGYAIEIEPAPALLVPKRATRRRSSAKPKADAANPGQPAGVDREDLAPDDRADAQPAVADAG